MKKQTQSAKFNFHSIKTFNDACIKEGLNFSQLPDVTNIPKEFAKPIIAAYKLMVIYKAINDGWKPDWSHPNKDKYYSWLSVLSSGFGFSGSGHYFDYSITTVGSRFCTDTSEKASYIAKQFRAEYRDLFLYPK